MSQAASAKRPGRRRLPAFLLRFGALTLREIASRLAAPWRRRLYADGRLLAEHERRLARRQRDAPAIDFIGTVDGTWSISIVNRTVVNAAMANGFRVGLWRCSGRLRWAIKDLVRAAAHGPAKTAPRGQADAWSPERRHFLAHRRRAREIVIFGNLELIRRRDFGAFNAAWVVFETSPIPARHRRALAPLDLVLVPSTFVKELLVASGVPGGKIEVFAHCLDTAAYNPARAAAAHPGDGVFRFLNIGLDHVKQGKALLLEAFLTEFEPDEPVALLLKATRHRGNLGRREAFETGPVAELLAQARARLGRRRYPRVEILTPAPIPDLSALYGRADCFVAPLLTNGFALTVLEAMACGRPAIVTRYGGLLDYCDDANAFLVEVEAFEPAGDRQYYAALADRSQGVFARPALADLRRQMRLAFTRADLVQERGARAARAVAEAYSPEVNAEVFGKMMRRRVPPSLLRSPPVGAFAEGRSFS